MTNLTLTKSNEIRTQLL